MFSWRCFPFVDSTPRAYRLKASNAAPLISTSAGTIPIAPAQPMITAEIVCAEQANFRGNRFIDEGFNRTHSKVINDARDYVTLALHRADDCALAACTAPALVFALAFVAVVVVAANVGFINLDNAAKLFDIFNKRSSDLVAHLPSGLVRTETHETIDLHRTHALLAREHEVSNTKPVAKGLVRVLENRSSDVRKPITVGGAFLALPMPLARFEIIDLGIAAARAAHTIGPSTSDQIGFASFFVGKHRLELGSGELMNGFRTACHG